MRQTVPSTVSCSRLLGSKGGMAIDLVKIVKSTRPPLVSPAPQAAAHPILLLMLTVLHYGTRYT